MQSVMLKSVVQKTNKLPILTHYSTHYFLSTITLLVANKPPNTEDNSQVEEKGDDTDGEL